MRKYVEHDASELYQIGYGLFVNSWANILTVHLSIKIKRTCDNKLNKVV